jgi:hypothetical protein
MTTKNLGFKTLLFVDKIYRKNLLNKFAGTEKGSIFAPA